MVRGSFFLFINKPHTLLKAVWFDGTGLCLFCKRLEQGQFSWPQAAAITEGKWLQMECKRTGTDFYLWLTEVLRKLPIYRTTEGYLNLLPGMLKLESPA